MECFNCHKKGHFLANCPDNDGLFCRGVSTLQKNCEVASGLTKPGIVEGKIVNDILLNTGCSRTLIHQKLVPECKVLQDEAVAIRCAHSDTVLYPLAQVQLEVDGQSLNITAAVAERLPVSVLLGTDFPLLTELLSGKLSTVEPVSKIEHALVVTRAEAKKQLDVEIQLEREDLLSGANPKPMETLPEGSTIETRMIPEEIPPIVQDQDTVRPEWEFDDELFVGGRKKNRLTKGQKRKNKKEYAGELLR